MQMNNPSLLRGDRLLRRSRFRFVPWSAALCLIGALALPARPAGASESSSVRAYLLGVSARLQAMWVGVVLADVASTMVENDPFNDPRRQVTIRVHFSGRGALEDARVMKTSGYAPFDQTALHAVLLSHAFPRPPRAALSDNGHVYLDWVFRRSRPYLRPASSAVYRKLLPAQRAVRKFLRLGRFDRAVARLVTAYRQGRLSQAAHAFGLEVIRLAATQGRAVDAKNFVRTLADAAMPLEVFRALLGGLVGSGTYAAVVRNLVARRQPAADRVIAQQFAAHYPGRPVSALVFLRGLLARPEGSSLVLAPLRRALKDPNPVIAASAAALLDRAGRPRDRKKALSLLITQLRSGAEPAELAALRVVGGFASDASLYALVEGIALNSSASTPLRQAALLALARFRSPKALKQVLLLTYRRKEPEIQLAALRALASRQHLARPFCYRLMTLISKPGPAPLLRVSGQALARGCTGVLPYEVQTAARNRRSAVRLGIATALPPAGHLTDRILVRLARDSVKRVRIAAIRRMSEQNRPAFAAPLSRAARSRISEVRRVGLLHSRDRKLLGRALSREQGEWWLKIARHAIRVHPKLVFGQLLRLLRRKDWEARLRAAWVLMALRAPTPAG